MKASEVPVCVDIPEPFANGGLLNPVQEVASSQNDVTFHDGFPSVYSAPSQDGGKFVGRGQINALGNLATVNEYFRACGGINTFDQRLANKIGGYYKGAVLEIVEGLRYSKVISLVDDNMVDFTGSPVDSNIINNQCIVGKVDGVNWAYCDGQYITGNINILDIPDFSSPDEDTTEGSAANTWEAFPVGNFTSPSNGVFTVSGGGDVYLPVKMGVSDYNGFAILIKKNASGGPFQEQYSIIYARGEVDTSEQNNGIRYNSFTDSTLVDAEKGERYSVWILNQNAKLTNSTLKLQIA